VCQREESVEHVAPTDFENRPRRHTALVFASLVTPYEAGCRLTHLVACKNFDMIYTSN
jgi:hypothetical protein